MVAFFCARKPPSIKLRRLKGERSLSLRDRSEEFMAAGLGMRSLFIRDSYRELKIIIKNTLHRYFIMF